MAMIYRIILSLSLLSVFSASEISDEKNEDIITVLRHVVREIKELKQHGKEQDARENATEKAIHLLSEQNTEIKEILSELKKDVKDLKSQEDVKKIKSDVATIKNVLTKPLPGKTWKKPSESCQWLNERFYNLRNGNYWTKVNGLPKYSQCAMNEAGIPPVRCSSNPCHANAECEDIDIGVRCTCNCGYKGDGKQCQKSSMSSAIGNGNMLIPETCSLKQNNLLTTFAKVNQEYLVRFEIYPKEFAEHGPQNIIHFTVGLDCCHVGQRIPGIWFQGGGQLYLCSAVNDKGDFCMYGDNTVVQLYQWSKIEIKQQMIGSVSYRYTVAINGRQVVSVINSKARVFYDIKVYVSDPWYPSQKSFIRNLYVEGYE